MSIRTELGGTRGVTVVALAFAAAYLVLGIVKHDPWLSVAGPLIMLVYLGGLYLFRSRSEPAALLAGSRADERQRQVITLASAAVGNVLILVTVVGFLVAFIAGDTTLVNVMSSLAAIGGVTFAAAVFWFSRHR